MPRTLYPYKLRISLTQTDADRLAVIADRSGTGITAMIRRYVREGLDRDKVTAPAHEMPGQTTLEDEK
ncbi:ribbon-helix-helix protein, CopG family [Streptomyces albidoflavus]|uniref:ribbon-helix-helix protein, CopG family n=1 Tax=Streptomyces albidoflavus TaxID=1886 RepID=UPI00332976AB